MGYSSWGLKESDTTEQLHFHFFLSHFHDISMDISQQNKKCWIPLGTPSCKRTSPSLEANEALQML